MANHAKVIQSWIERSRGTVTAARASAAHEACQKAGLTPKSGLGGGRKAIHWTVAPLVNHMITLAVADPITAAPKTVPEYRDLRHMFTRVTPPSDLVTAARSAAASSELQEPDFLTPIVPRDTFAGTIEAVVTAIATDPRAREWFRASRLNLVFGQDHAHAEVRYTRPNGEHVAHIFLPPKVETPPRTEAAGLEADRRDQVGFDRTAVVYFPTLEMLADLLADTLARQGASPPSSQTGSASSVPENESTGSVGAEPVQSGQPNSSRSARHQAGPLTSSEPNRVCVNLQWEREPVAGWSTPPPLPNWRFHGAPNPHSRPAAFSTSA
jgi:hypothetical protein